MDFLTKRKADKKEAAEAEADKKDEEKDKVDKKPAAAEGEAKEKESKVCSMKRGDYMIHVMVEQAKEL